MLLLLNRLQIDFTEGSTNCCWQQELKFCTHYNKKGNSTGFWKQSASFHFVISLTFPPHTTHKSTFIVNSFFSFFFFLIWRCHFIFILCPDCWLLAHQQQRKAYSSSDCRQLFLLFSYFENWNVYSHYMNEFGGEKSGIEFGWNCSCWAMETVYFSPSDQTEQFFRLIFPFAETCLILTWIHWKTLSIFYILLGLVLSCDCSIHSQPTMNTSIHFNLIKNPFYVIFFSMKVFPLTFTRSLRVLLHCRRHRSLIESQF